MIATDSFSLRFLGVRTFGMALLVAAVAAGCGSSKPSGDAGGSGGSGFPGTGGRNGGGTGGNSGTGGRVDGGSFDLNLDGFSLDGLNLDGFSLDGLNLDGGFDVNIKACPDGVKSGDTCTSGVDTACVTGQKACFCNSGKWTCLGG